MIETPALKRWAIFNGEKGAKQVRGESGRAEARPSGGSRVRFQDEASYRQ